ncbi:hypothetical protein CU633_07045 [Bacillus sp. V3-13]|uniref:N-acetylglucosaminidase n=1 Tax=Bacillus sp. V3-13 TaxID=2053728 RepID=UPI000C781071|nr:glucosaminidase domain-containing protein [Bacillus sp. V3-13]PLR78264.1 hypothetical protein CU633_07045 [Bacillus sp. V3-13]
MRKVGLSFLSLFLLVNLSLFPRTSSAYTDYSIHTIETGAFFGEQNVINALQRLKADTGWWATYESTGQYIPYYQVNSGGFYGEENIKEKLNQFQSSTGFSASFHPVGNPEAYRKVVSSSYYGEENVQRIVQEFINNTGFSASYENTGESIDKKKIMSGAFFGEGNVQQVLQQFQAATGISATYEPTGQYQEYFQVVSGGFYGENNVKTVLQEFMNNTGLNASYEPILYADVYNIVTGGFYGEENVKAVVNQIKNDLGLNVIYEPTNTSNVFNIRFDQLFSDSYQKTINYLDQKGWWYSKTPTGTKVATHYRVVSEPIIDKVKLNSALSFFSNRNWWAATSSTGNKVYNYFYIVSNPLTDTATINRGLDFFSTKGYWAAVQTTNEKIYPYFKIVSEHLLGNEKVDKAINFFKDKGYWVTSEVMDQTGYTTFQITSQPLLGTEQSEKALNFFKSNNWWAQTYPTGAKEGHYKIVTGGFQGYDNAVANAKMVTDRYGWWTTTKKQQNGPQITYTNYNLTMNEMFNAQMQLSTPPQTDKYRNDPAYVHSDYVDRVNNKITATRVNVRNGPGTNYEVVAQLNSGFSGFRILGTEGSWTKIALTWKNAKLEDVVYYLNPNNFPSNSKQYFQFLKLSQLANINVDEVNEKVLNANAGSLRGTAASFAKAAQQYGVNELYLIAHALHETGNGSSSLARGVNYNGRTVYNMYGYGAYDSCAVDCGAKRAYDEGWFTPELAIVGGARLIGNGYIYNSTFQQDTLYKMRWNPVQPWHQYATDIGWAAKQVDNIYNYYQLLDNYTLYIDIPVYK